MKYTIINLILIALIIPISIFYAILESLWFPWAASVIIYFVVDFARFIHSKVTHKDEDKIESVVPKSSDKESMVGKKVRLYKIWISAFSFLLSKRATKFLIIIFLGHLVVIPVFLILFLINASQGLIF